MRVNRERGYITNVEVTRDEVHKIRLLHGSFKTMSQWYAETKADILMTGALITNKTGIPIERYATDGKVLSTSDWCTKGFGINYDGTVTFGEYGHYYRDFTSAFPMLVWNSKAGINFEPSADIAGANPRAIFSQTNKGFLFTTIDGRQKGMPGMNIWDAAKYVGSLGVIHSANMDGGGAAVICVKGKILNSPCENRPLSNVISVWLKNEDGGSNVNKKICIDAGHNYSGHDTGAAGNGLREQDITFEIAKQAEELLTKAGFEVKLTRNNLTDNLGGAPTIASSCNARAKIANDFKADLFLSVHCNAFTTASPNGTECWVYKRGNSATPLAEKIVDSIVKTVGTSKRSTPIVENQGLIVLRETNMPAVLIETAFISNPADAEKLRDRKTDFARAIAGSVAAHYGVSLSEEAVPAGNKYSYDNTINKLVELGIITAENMAYWEKVLSGREQINLKYLRTLLDRCCEKVV